MDKNTQIVTQKVRLAKPRICQQKVYCATRVYTSLPLLVLTAILFVRPCLFHVDLGRFLKRPKQSVPNLDVLRIVALRQSMMPRMKTRAEQPEHVDVHSGMTQRTQKLVQDQLTNDTVNMDGFIRK